MKENKVNCSDKIKLRPHHGLCIRHFIGKGYNNEFTNNMAKVIEKLNKNPEQEIYLYTDTDVLCLHCPNNKDGVCISCDKVKNYDEKCFDFCGLSEGQILTWQKFNQIINDKIIISGNMNNICSDCQWYRLCLDVAYSLNN